MTEFTLMSTVVGGIALAVVVAFSLIFLPTILHTETELKTSEKGIEVINAAHLVKACLETRDGIPEAVLESNKGRDICDICGNELSGMCRNSIELGVKVRDLEGPKEWNLGYKEDEKYTTEIFVNILHDAGRITMGRLYAEI